MWSLEASEWLGTPREEAVSTLKILIEDNYQFYF